MIIDLTDAETRRGRLYRRAVTAERRVAELEQQLRAIRDAEKQPAPRAEAL